MLLYSLLYLTGYEDMTLEQVMNFRQLGASPRATPNTATPRGSRPPTGPLGQGVANAVGFAMAREFLRAKWGRKVIDHHTYVFAVTGCLMEGHQPRGDRRWPARQELSRLILIFDDNGITIDGKVEIADRTDQQARFAARGLGRVSPATARPRGYRPRHHRGQGACPAPR